ncbi:MULTISPECIES: DUF3800 domain-containing protein [Bradyrhizobium]|uniref:DUF3800 domain-containing protein n=1 Tax=Bradyrhizobium elkanii TaxID=29448 RepID=A0A7Y8R6L5_BRAEL|nr:MULTISPECIES: DUF3800 domain-containing protein [Bradyrhizobium]MBP1290622.1 hypothetical protein [Bradyrhizobium elkanii]MCP1755407.1 hypothetical protein [Bradyrhizobium elkanii]MCP1929068.1 hypothetical protein [Bradyrhizobium elkanii]MCP1972386.1 hypothetical protein [Bradyrhizobium elkanii]MCP1980924.1 hypothetical protein [Bradyrhizobium elkanii]
MDIDEFRNSQMRLYGLTKADESYTFYHDETNNIIKLHVGVQGLNVAELKVFVLGGVVHEGAPRAIDIEPLRAAMRVQKSAPEIKLKHVAKGDFLAVLRSAKLTTVLRWIADNGLMIHYHDLDPLYWSIVDIIDSILSELRDPVLIQYHALLKSDLAAVLRSYLAATINLFYRYNYPDLVPEHRKPFLNELVDLLNHSVDVLSPVNARMLKNVLKAGRSLESLDFIEGYPPHLLIDDFSTFYMGRIAIFKNSAHVLDMEESIRDRFERTPLTSGGKPVTHYRFADSKAEPGIQLSDIVVGVLGKMHTYFTETAAEEIAADRAGLAGTSLQNAELLRDLISASHVANIAFLNHVSSLHDLDKLDLFLRFYDGAHAA